MKTVSSVNDPSKTEFIKMMIDRLSNQAVYYVLLELSADVAVKSKSTIIRTINFAFKKVYNSLRFANHKNTKLK